MKPGDFFARPYMFGVCFSAFLVLLTALLLCETFIFPHVMIPEGELERNNTDEGVASEEISPTTSVMEQTTSQTAEQDKLPSPEKQPNIAETAESHFTEETVRTDTSYSDKNIFIDIKTREISNTTVYIADIYLRSAEYLKTALANDAYGTNITQKTSVIADTHNAILAINGDYYGADKKGYVIKNGALYRSSVRSDSDFKDLVIYKDGSFGIIDEADISAKELINDGVQSLFAFGPVLVENGEITESASGEVSKAMASNPRTAIGIIEPLHYVFIVSDGRTAQSEGLSLEQLAELMAELGCETSYNLDGGGSSTMYFCGEIVNNPTTNGRKITERAVSDIVYIG